MDENTNNGDFEDLAPGANNFAHWDEADLFRAECFADDSIYRDDGIGGDNYAIRYEVNQINEAKNEDPVKNLTDIDSFPGLYTVDPGDRMRLKGYTRTREVDSFRLGCPWQWEESGYHFREPVIDAQGKYLGQLQWGLDGKVPMDEETKVHWKRDAGGVAIAEWCWGLGFPSRPYLKNIWWDPFVTCHKEVSW